jgi:hypothetical protein
MMPLGAGMIETDLATQEASRKRRYLPSLNLSSQRHLDEVDRPTTTIVARVPSDRHNLMELAWRIPIDCELRGGYNQVGPTRQGGGALEGWLSVLPLGNFGDSSVRHRVTPLEPGTVGCSIPPV